MQAHKVKSQQNEWPLRLLVRRQTACERRPTAPFTGGAQLIGVTEPSNSSFVKSKTSHFGGIAKVCCGKKEHSIRNDSDTLNKKCISIINEIRDKESVFEHAGLVRCL